MRLLTFALLALIALAGCGGTAAPAATVATPAPAAPVATAASTPARAASSAVEGFRVTVDGQMFEITGEPRVTAQRAGAVGVLFIGKNPSPSALAGGNGVMLELQFPAVKDGFPAGVSARDAQYATFTIWKGVEFSYVSTGAMPGQAIKGLVLSESGGKLAGSFEDELTGKLGKLKAKIEFNVPAAK